MNRLPFPKPASYWEEVPRFLIRVPVALLLDWGLVRACTSTAGCRPLLWLQHFSVHLHPQPSYQKFFKRRNVHLFALINLMNLINIPISCACMHTHTPLMKIRVLASLNQLAKVDLVLSLNHHISISNNCILYPRHALCYMLNKFIIFMYHKTFWL